MHEVTSRLSDAIAERRPGMRDHLGTQMRETERMAAAARSMLDIARENDAIAREFNTTVQNLMMSGRNFESEVARFRYSGTEDRWLRSGGFDPGDELLEIV